MILEKRKALCLRAVVVVKPKSRTRVFGFAPVAKGLQHVLGYAIPVAGRVLLRVCSTKGSPLRTGCALLINISAVPRDFQSPPGAAAFHQLSVLGAGTFTRCSRRGSRPAIRGPGSWLFKDRRARLDRLARVAAWLLRWVYCCPKCGTKSIPDAGIRQERMVIFRD